MRNKDTVRFRIVEITSAELCDDLETVKKTTIYHLYRKVSWLLGNWQIVLNDKTYLPEFYSVEDARQRAYKYVRFLLENRKRDVAKKKMKNELKTTIKIVVDFECNDSYHDLGK